MRISLVQTDSPDRFACVEIRMPAGGTVARAVDLAGWLGNVDLSSGVGVWGRKVALSYVLQDGDRVELYRPLNVDPKVARRERFRQQGVRGTGLFTRSRKGVDSDSDSDGARL